MEQVPNCLGGGDTSVYTTPCEFGVLNGPRERVGSPTSNGLPRGVDWALFIKKNACARVFY